MMMNTLTDQEIQLFSQEFEKELVRLHDSSQSGNYWTKMLMPKHKMNRIIQHLKGIAPLEPSKERTWVEARKFQVFTQPGLPDELMEPTKEKVNVGGSSRGGSMVKPRYLKIVPRDDIFQTLLKIHLKHNHSTLRETLHLVRAHVSNVPRYLVHKFILLCPVCSNNGSTANSSGLPYTPSRRCMIKARKRRKLMDQFQVDVLDLNCNPDGDYRFILHCMDHITGFHWVFPLASVEESEVAQNLVWGIFSLFGFPSELVSDYGSDFAAKVIVEICKLWPDSLNIKNYLEGNTYKGDVTRRNTRNMKRFIDHMAIKKAALGDSRMKWSEWLPEIQFMLNATVLDVRTGKTPYEKVFRMTPITSVPMTKFAGNKIIENVTDEPNNLPQQQQEEEQQQEELVTEELVDHRDMATMHHTSGGLMGDGVVVVDAVGVEHTVQGFSGGNTPLQSAGMDYTNADGSSFTIMQPAGTDGSFSTFQQQQSSKLEQLRLDDIEYMEPHKWVTLSADGGQLEVAEIKPSIQEVKIGAAAGTMEDSVQKLFEPALRRGVYVDGSKKGVNLSTNLRLDNFKNIARSSNEKVIRLHSASNVSGNNAVPVVNTSVRKVVNAPNTSTPVLQVKPGYSTITLSRTGAGGGSKRILTTATYGNSNSSPPNKKFDTGRLSDKINAPQVPSGVRQVNPALATTIRTKVVTRPQLTIPPATQSSSSTTLKQSIIAGQNLSRNIIDQREYQLQIPSDNEVNYDDDHQFDISEEEEYDLDDGGYYANSNDLSPQQAIKSSSRSMKGSSARKPYNLADFENFVAEESD